MENARAGSSRWGRSGWAIDDGQAAAPDQLAAYASRTGVLSGEQLTVFVTTTAPSFRVTAFRIGWYGGAGARRVWSGPRVAGRVQPPPTVTAERMVHCAWAPSVEVVTAGWPPGSYLLVVADSRGRRTYVPLTVRSTGVTGRLVLVSAVPTYQAYNQWGGHSLYLGPDGSFDSRAYQVSYDRPYDENGARIPTQYEHAISTRAERLGLPLAYLTGLDLDADPHVLDGATGVVSLGHDEYWTTGMRATVTRARDAGTNVAFLGANAVYWRIRLAGGAGREPRVVVGYKSAALDPVTGPTTCTHWRSPPDPDPENSLLGSLYEDFPAQGPLVVHDPGFFLFRGTGTHRGATYPGLVGTEINRAYPIAGTPATLRVVAHSPVTGPAGPTYADTTYYTTPSGAGVFSVGTMAWNKALRGTDAEFGITAASVRFARTVTDNLLTAMAAGPMGRTHPAVGNLAGLGESADPDTGTGGPVTTARGAASPPPS